MVGRQCVFFSRFSSKENILKIGDCFFFSNLHMYLRWCWYSDVLLLKLSSRCFFGDDSVIRFAEL